MNTPKYNLARWLACYLSLDRKHTYWRTFTGDDFDWISYLARRAAKKNYRCIKIIRV